MSGPGGMLPRRRPNGKQGGNQGGQQGGRRGSSVVRGLVLLGRGRAEGFDCFDNSRDAFLAGLSPQIGFLLVAAALLLAQRPTVPALSLVLLAFCAVLLPPVISHAMARLWRRDERWRRYATASVWSIWLILPAYVPALLVASVLMQAGVGRTAAVQAVMLLVMVYFLWLQWFMARRGLAIGGFKAALTVLAIVAGSSLLGMALQPLLLEVMPEVR